MCLVDRFDVADGGVESYADIRTVGQLKQILADVENDMSVHDGQGKPLIIDVYRPKHLLPFIEVQ